MFQASEYLGSLSEKILTLEDLEQFVTRALQGKALKEQNPFAVFDKEGNKIVGSTRYLRISEENRNLSIGFTWYTPEVWRPII